MIPNLSKIIITWETDCMANGELCDYNKIFGAEDEFIGSLKEGIIISNHIYTDKTSFIEIAKCLGEYYPKIEEYDEIASMGRGWSGHGAQEEIIGNSDAIVIRSIENFVNMEIKSIEDFKIKYPEYNEHNYLMLMDAFDKFYSSKTKQDD